MSRYMPITGLDCNVPSLLIDTEASLDVLHETAAFRIRSATQLLETFALRDDIQGDASVLHEVAQALIISLRDGCDMLDVIGRRLRAQVSV